MRKRERPIPQQNGTPCFECGELLHKADCKIGAIMRGPGKPDPKPPRLVDCLCDDCVQDARETKPNPLTPDSSVPESGPTLNVGDQ